MPSIDRARDICCTRPCNGGLWFRWVKAAHGCINVADF